MEHIAEMQDFSHHVKNVEDRLAELDTALRAHDFNGIESASLSLHQTLANAMAAFRHAQQQGQNPLSDELKQRLVLAQSRVTGVQSVIHFSSASLLRTLDVLLERPGDAQSAAYTALGANRSATSSLKAYIS